MECLCERLAERMIRGGLLEADKKDWMVYILQKWAMKCVGVGLFLGLLGLLAGWWNALAFYAVFTGLRAYGGGWHAPRPWICFALSAALALAVGLGGPIAARWPAGVRVAASVVCAGVLWRLAPVQPQNLPLDAAERAVNRRKMLWRLAAAEAVFVLCEAFRIGDAATYIAIALVGVTVTVLAAWLAEKR